ncbi:AmpG family muropeptide MFS transporter [Metapseudomonas lalkuanensis]|uniref:AmpG family muropeptide MFS transporter n=1 Tax=Metapseudomonas lalkuanensis TaxID=2604832 RepID=A0A5J6QFF1_9GAMM|nr:AmpG family muropeptide MFS transporter [Pseudomonas lalkuanensis]QEY61458.1 AmpG family muropeptide MFS transporter [Pseudomonas lalkuanensis]UCO99221.1 AmpG family muropeptide MFS transporter [Pseudomonas lalkuanensis]
MPHRSWRAAIAAYASPATLSLLLLGFAAGLPYMLVFSTLSVWLREAGVSRETIGFASLIGLAYAFKWIWSPLLDQWRLPLLGRLGRRRSWLVLSQALVGLGLVGMALCDPQTNLTWLIALAVVVAFASATQDIAIDAYRLEIAEDSRQAALAASYMTGYRISALLATAGALYFAEWFGSTAKVYEYGAWAGTYLLFALLMLPGLITSLWMREPLVDLPAQGNNSRFKLKHQLSSVLILLVMLISLPAMITGMLDRAWPRAALYAIFLITCLSPWGMRQILPVRELLSQQRRQLLVAARGKVMPNFDFVHQAVSIIVLIVILVTIAAAVKAFSSGAWPRGTMFLLITLACFSAAGRLLMAPVLTPISEFVQRYRWQALLLLGLIATYRMSDTVMGVMANVFYIDQGFTKEQIASVSKLFGLVMTLLGAAAGGVLIVRFGILPILFIGGVSSAATNLMFVALSDMGPHLNMLILTISCDNFSAGLATSAFVAYLSSLTNLKFSATQYALLSSIMLLLPRLIGGYSGVMVESVGYHNFFMLTALLGIPTLVLIAIQWGRDRQQPKENGSSDAPAAPGSTEQP